MLNQNRLFNIYIMLPNNAKNYTLHQLMWQNAEIIYWKNSRYISITYQNIIYKSILFIKHFIIPSTHISYSGFFKHSIVILFIVTMWAFVLRVANNDIKLIWNINSAINSSCAEKNRVKKKNIRKMMKRNNNVIINKHSYPDYHFSDDHNKGRWFKLLYLISDFIIQ